MVASCYCCIFCRRFIVLLSFSLLSRFQYAIGGGVGAVMLMEVLVAGHASRVLQNARPVSALEHVGSGCTHGAGAPDSLASETARKCRV